MITVEEGRGGFSPVQKPEMAFLDFPPLFDYNKLELLWITIRI